MKNNEVSPLRMTPQRGRQTPAPVRLHIGELVLHGFASGDRESISAGVRGELARLLGCDRTLSSLESPVAVERAGGVAFETSSSETTRSAETQIARAIYQALQQNVRSAVNPSASAGQKEFQR